MTAGKHAIVALFYAGAALADKGYLSKVLDVAKTKNGGFGKYSFLSADEFTGHADPRFDGVLIEGAVPEALSDRIENAYKAIGKGVKVFTGSFKEEFERFEKEAGVGAGVTADPPMSATDNVTASSTSPQSHVETDGRNEPRLWSHTTGTSLDFFGLPLSTSDRTDASAAERESGLEAQGQAVTARTARRSTQSAERQADKADKAEANEKAAQKAREDAAKAEEEAKKAEADEKAKTEAEAKAKADADAAK